MSGQDAQATGRLATIVLCGLTAFAEGIDLQAAGITATGIVAQFNPSSDEMGTYFSAGTFGLFFGAVSGGKFADSIGRKWVLISSVALFGLFSLLTSLAWSMSSLTIMRALTGLGLGGALPMLLALVTESSPAGSQSSSVALVYAATPLGGALISLLVVLSGTSHWRAVFVGGGVYPLLLAIVMAVRLPESRVFLTARGHAWHVRLPSSELMPRAGSLSALFADGRGWSTGLLWLSFFLGLLLLYLLLNWLPSLLVGAGLTVGQAASAQIGFNVGGAVAAGLMGHLLKGRHRNASLVIAFVAVPILLVALAKMPANIDLLYATVFLLGCAVLATQAFLYTTAPIAYPTSIRGIGVGLAVAAGRVGSIIGPKLGGLLKSAGHSTSQLLMDVLPLVLVGSACALMLARQIAQRSAK